MWACFQHFRAAHPPSKAWGFGDNLVMLWRSDFEKLLAAYRLGQAEARTPKQET
jgi:hypothetical protein